MSSAQQDVSLAGKEVIADFPLEPGFPLRITCNVTWDLFTNPGGGQVIDDDGRDTHLRNFEILKDIKLP